MIGKSVLERTEEGFVSVIRMLGIVTNHQLTAIAQSTGIMSTARWWFMIQKNHGPVVVHDRRVVIVRRMDDLMPVIRDRLIVANLRNHFVPMAIGFDRPHQALGRKRRQDRSTEPTAAKLQHRTIGMLKAS